MKKVFAVFFSSLSMLVHAQSLRTVQLFTGNWKFHLGDVAGGEQAGLDESGFRSLSLPHDWSIEGAFSKDNPATPEGGALPGGIGWYRKNFTVPAAAKDKMTYIDFDGVYQKSDVWINGHHLGFRPNGYISFRYDLTPFLNYGGGQNVLAVKVDNSAQPNSRWYSGSGIYRNVWMVSTAKVAVDHWGSFVTTPKISRQQATVQLVTQIKNNGNAGQAVTVKTYVRDAAGKTVAASSALRVTLADSSTSVPQTLLVKDPVLWTLDRPYLYKVVTEVSTGQTLADRYETPLGIRYFQFDINKGFFLNGKPVKIRGVCDHHDLGALGAAINLRALERQLELLKEMGCNGIRTSHNPPAPELLDLCDRMGFVVMDEAFDVWQRRKMRYDYHLFFNEWHKRDIEDQVLRDRNHPSVFIWSMGNEIPEQRDTSAFRIARELAGIYRSLDTTRPLTTANNNPDTGNQIIRSGSIELVGYNYHHRELASFQTRYPGKKFIGTETTSALETRGYYEMPSDSIRRWNNRNKFVTDSQYVVSAYDNVSAPWGSTHEETWKEIKKYDFLSGMFIWTGFDYLGEPTPYTWPARSSYFGILDLAGFPKDLFYMYQSEWTSKPVLHLFPHWNWQPGQTVDVWAFYNNADEVELFLNGRSLGTKKKEGEDLHVMWRVPFAPGTLKAVSRKGGKTVLTREVYTAGTPARIELSADRSRIRSDGHDLSFVTVKVVDKEGHLVPGAENRVSFGLTGPVQIAGVDNGDPVSHDSFKAKNRKAFHGKALVILQAGMQAGKAILTATADGLQSATLPVTIQ